jgi:hypothetical protein
MLIFPPADECRQNPKPLMLGSARRGFPQPLDLWERRGMICFKF